ncbi:MAG: helix-turn-helix domain-containing protein, partial [Clostridiales bacterium]|nr:helix-turn-helix domain-containing protein [Clostridiales bacterium]
MQYITVQEAAKKWGVTTRRVQMLCNEERIKGAYRFGKSWMIPSTAV